jgi:hypothetical protein
VGGIPEMLDGGEAGVLVPPHDPVTLANALERLLTDPARRAELAARAVQDLEKFSVQRVSDGYLAIYERTLASCQPRRFATIATRDIDAARVGMTESVSHSAPL